MGELDLDAIKAAWRGFDAELWVALDEEADEWVITSADDGSPYTGVLARLECDYAEQLGALWGGAGPQVAALVAEVEGLRAERDALRAAIDVQAAAVRQHDAAQAAIRAADARDAATLRRREATPGDTLAELAAAREEARRWNARATELEEERDALRAIVEGRTTGPTTAEARAVKNAGGCFVRTTAGRVRGYSSCVSGLARLGSEAEDQRHSGNAMWFVVDRYGRPCAWPVVEVSRG